MSALFVPDDRDFRGPKQSLGNKRKIYVRMVK
jgi:hypothetical protein